MAFILNRETLTEDLRRLGIIAIATGIIHGLFEQGDPETAVIVAALGLTALLLGNLEKRP